MKVLLGKLVLAYPPISNQEADWLSADTDFREFVKSSKLYMIGQRPEVTFDETRFHLDNDNRILHFVLVQQATGTEASVEFPLDPAVGKHEGDLEIELGRKLIRIWPIERESGQEPILWFTPDKFLFNCWQGHMPVEELSGHREFTTFDLLYVGISKAQDSITRLFDQGHKARLRILSNESQIVPTARLTDELMIFLFNIERLGVSVFDSLEEYFSAPAFPDEPLRVVADAEKAFVRLLDPKYNLEKYPSYPAGEDGLYDVGLSRYGYHIGEDITFEAPNGTFIGSVLDKEGSIILIEGDDARLITLDGTAQ